MIAASEQHVDRKLKMQKEEKMKKLIITLVSIVLVFGLLSMCNVTCAIHFIMPLAGNARIIYKTYGSNIDAPLTREDAEEIKNIVNGKLLYYDSPSCGFDEKVAVSLNGRLLMPACDTCPTLKYKNKYMSVSKEQIATIHQIFAKYGGTFPCV